MYCCTFCLSMKIKKAQLLRNNKKYVRRKIQFWQEGRKVEGWKFKYWKERRSNLIHAKRKEEGRSKKDR